MRKDRYTKIPFLEKKTPQRRGKWKMKYRFKQCAYCGKDVPPERFKYCSEWCYRLGNNEKHKEWAAKNVLRRRLLWRRWYHSDPDNAKRRAEYMKKWYKKHPGYQAKLKKKNAKKKP